MNSSASDPHSLLAGTSLDSGWEPPKSWSRPRYQLKASHHRAIEGLLLVGIQLSDGIKPGEAADSSCEQFKLDELDPDAAVARKAHELLLAADLITPVDGDTFEVDGFAALQVLTDRPAHHIGDLSAYDIWQVATLLEVACAGVTAQCIDDAQLTLLQQALPWRPFDPTTQTGGFVDLHRLIALFTGNHLLRFQALPVLMLRSTGLYEILNASLEEPASGMIQVIETDRARLIEAFRAEDPQAARVAMQAHMDHLRDFWFEPVPADDWIQPGSNWL